MSKFFPTGGVGTTWNSLEVPLTHGANFEIVQIQLQAFAKTAQF